MNTRAATEAAAPSLWKRLVFRFALFYFLLYTHPFPLSYLPNPSTVARALEQEWSFAKWTHENIFAKTFEYSQWYREREWALIDRVAVDVFAIESSLDRPRGSGDPTHSYVRLSIHLSVALVLTVLTFLPTLLWKRLGTILALGPWLHLLARYWLAFIMFSYGIAKVIPMQFGFPSLTRLLSPYGDGSPMNILWSFVGSSEPYIIFTGASEALAGLLLIFRRTATLGALVCAAVMTNVVALNFCYDVPVKLYSSHILLCAFALLVPDLRRLLRFFLLGKGTEARDLSRPRLPYVGHAARILVIGTYLLGAITSTWRNHERFRNQDHPLRGIWDVQDFALDGTSIPPLTTKRMRWENLIVESGTFAVVRRMDETRSNHSMRLDLEKGTLTLTSSATFAIKTWNGNELVLEGDHQRTRKNVPWLPTSEENPEELRAPQIRITLRAQDAAPTNAELRGRFVVTSWDVIGKTYLTRRRPNPPHFEELEFVDDSTCRVSFASGRTDTYGLAVDSAQNRLTLRSNSTFTLTREGEDQMTLTGTLRGHELTTQLVRRDLEEFLLTRRGFQWINEMPFNRY